MSWNQGGGGGPWGSGGGGPGPWGSGGGRGNFQPPNFEDALRRFQALLRRLLPGGGRSGLGGPRGWALGIAIVLVIWVMSGIYRVEPDEQGVVLRFGAFNRTATPGLNYHLPDPIEEALTPTVTRINRVEIGYRSDQALGRGGRMTEVPEEALMLTGDENIADVNLAVFWLVKDAQAYVFNIRNPEVTVKAAAESAVREIIGHTELATALAEGRIKIEADTQTLLQQILDSYGAGVEITQVQLQKVDPPGPVIDAFRDVQSAKIDLQTLVNQAQAYSNNVVPVAHGDAARVGQEAQAYKAQVVLQAQGDAARFLSVYASYQAAQDVTARRLYIETMESILKSTSKYPHRQDRVGLGRSALSSAASAVDRAASCGFSGRRGAGCGKSALQRGNARAKSNAMSARTGGLIGGVVVVILFLLYTMLFTVRQTEIALVLQFGKPIRVIEEPGLQFKLPYQNAVIYDRRILDYEPPAEEVIASDQKRLVVDTYARFKIVNPLQFYQSVGTEDVADARLSTIISASLRNVIGNVELQSVISTQRAAIMLQIRDQVNREAKGFGIDVVDVQAAARRSARPRTAGDLRSDEDRASARGGAIPRPGRPAGAARSEPTPTASASRSWPMRKSRRRSCAAKAMPKASSIYADAYGKDRISSPSTARSRLITTACRGQERLWCSRPTASSSDTSRVVRRARLPAGAGARR